MSVPPAAARPALAPPRAEVRPGVWLDARRALWFEAPRLLVVADLHWGYSATHRARGNLLPAWGDDALAAALAQLAADYAPAEFLWLGDIVHAAEGAARAEAFLRTASVPVTLIGGNHDRRWPVPTVPHAARAGYFFHHGDRALPVPAGLCEVVGHHHPAFLWDDGAGTRLKLPALVAGPQRLVLPAFSPWAAGTPWAAAGADTLWTVAPTRVFAVSSPSRPSRAA